MNTWTNEEINKLYNYVAKEHNITFNDAKFVVEGCEKYSLKLSNKIEDFEDNSRLGKESLDILIEFCKTKDI